MKTKFEDKELESLLSRMDNSALRVFADLLVYNNENKPRISEGLTNNRLYKHYYPNNMNLLIPELINEFQHFGGNTIVNMFRGHGVSYEQILKDLCSKFNVKTRDTYSVETLEMALVDELLEKILEGLSKSDILGFMGDLGLEVSVDSTKIELCDKLRKVFHNKTFILVILKCIIKNICPKVLEFSDGEQTEESDTDKVDKDNLWGIVGLGVGAGTATVGANAVRFVGTTLVPVVTRLVPVVNTITAAWLIKEFSGPNEKVTLPCTLFIIFQRIKLSLEADIQK